MAAPSFASPVDAPRTRLWLPVTVRVAWELVAARERVHPAVLAGAREHVLRCLPDGVGTDEAEAMAGPLTQDFLIRLRDGRYVRPSVDIGEPVPRAWRDRMFESVDPLGDAVLRMYYGDGLSLEDVERHAAVHISMLESAVEGVRETLRVIAMDDGQAADDWSDDRVDAALRRVATLAGPSCPGPVGLLSEAGREHASRCPRCSRAVRLIRQGVISPADLFPPEGEPAVPTGRLSLLALLLHPDGRKHHKLVANALGARALAVGQDAWLLPADEIAALTLALQDLAEQGTPPRHQLRGAVAEGPARLVRGTLLGPLPVTALEEARSRPWSEIDQVGELPATLPPPPSAARWWLIAMGMSALTLGTGALVLSPKAATVTYPLTVQWSPQSARFDTDDLAVVDVVSLDAGGLHVRDAGLRADKGHYATGQGDFELPTEGGRLVIIASEAGISGLSDLVAGVALATDPIAALVDRVALADPHANVAVSPAAQE